MKPDDNIAFLCVTDDAEICEQLRLLITKFYPKDTFISVSNGSEAVIAVEESNPDVFIIDSEIPPYDYGLIGKAILALNKRGKTIILSRPQREGGLTNSKSTTLQNRIAKPIDSGRLQAVIDALVGGSHKKSDTFEVAKSKFFSNLAS